MKAYTARMAVLAVLAAVVTVGSAFAGQTQAERDMAAQQRVTSPEFPVWDLGPVLETGSLPKGEASVAKSEGAAGEIHTVEIGGSVFRVGIDTQ